MTTNDWCNLNYQPFKEACERICEGNSLAEELAHYVLTEFLTRVDCQTIIDSGGAFFFCLRIATNNWKSTTSPFYRNYRDARAHIELNEHHYQQMEEIGKNDEEVYEHTNRNERTKQQMNGLEEQPELTFEDLYEQVQSGMEKLGWYERELLQVYAENNGNASLVSRLTKIPRTSINLTIRKIKVHLTKQIK